MHPVSRFRSEPFARAAARGLFAVLVALAAACSDGPVAPVPVETVPAGSAERAPDAGPSLLAGARLWVDPASRARRQADAWRSSRPGDAAQMDKIANRPQAVWLGDWISNPFEHVSQLTRTIVATGATPVYVLYNIPGRDCGQYSAGGASTPEAYLAWISEVARGIGGQKVAVILEPDAVGLMQCVPAAQVDARYRLLREAVQRLRAGGNIAVYIDAGNARWHSVEELAARLLRAGVDRADGFALNVAFSLSTDESVRFGEQISARVGGKHFVVDTGRNGLGPTADLAWCNPPGRALGREPTTRTGHALVDAYLWVKHPGESDGTCNGGPPAGGWWADYALGLAQRSGL